MNPIPVWLRLHLADRYAVYRRFAQDPAGWPSELISDQELLAFALDDFDASLAPLRTGELVAVPWQE
jgi:hypothetical protein